ncbi:putative ATP-binding protein involved in virulence [Oceanisphaera litoralis]|uniref:AAA family ATPase n=1 Tax=Oceanisphaera litoralis TaxID=225144 RepID=UPI00195B19E5|nr:AAA family ATPase [Oceanisphaera litoralis]MBM7455585.1 putative ATP-binding protein involved in virulence [Oceanisphaera litoralis]
MKVNTLILKNFRCYKDLTITLNSRLTVLVAANGEGKTSILDALRIAFWPFVSQFDLARTAYNDPANGIQIDDVRATIVSKQLEGGMAAGVIDETARQLPCSIVVECEQHQQAISWERVRESEAKRSQTLDGPGCAQLKKHARSLQEAVRDLSTVPQSLPLFGYYGTGRLWQHKRLVRSKKSVTDKKNQKIRTFAYRDCLDPASNYRQFEEWFINIFKSAREQQIAALERGSSVSLEQTPYFTMIRVIQRAINTVLEPVGWQNLAYSQSHDQALVLSNREQGIFKVSQLSDGIKNMLGMIADIAYRCVQLNSHLGEAAAELTEGVVMIDEIEMHLHPAWQQLVVASLNEAFPRLQFILTTHSPQVLTTVPSESIWVLENGHAHAAPPGSKGADSARLLQRIFGVNSRPLNDENTQLLQAYEHCVYADKWNTKEALQMRADLDKVFEGQEPKLTELDLYIENRQWELDLEKDQ